MTDRAWRAHGAHTRAKRCASEETQRPLM